MKLNKIISFAIAIICIALAVGCDKDPIVEPAEIKVSQSEIDLGIKPAPVTITIVSNHNWKIEMEVINPMEGETSKWLSVSPQSGNGGTAAQTITLTAQENPADGYKRGVKVRFIADKAKDSIIVRQDGKDRPGVQVTKSISEIRALQSNIEEGKGYVISDSWVVEGVVVSDLSEAGNNVSNKSMMIQDDVKENSGLCVRFTTSTVCVGFSKGQKVKVVLTNGALSLYNKQLQFTPESDNAVTKIDGGKAYDATPITVDNLKTGKWESMYVSIENCQVKESDLGAVMAGNIKMETPDAKDFVMYTGTYAAFKEDKVPQGSGKLKGLAGVYQEVYQIIPVLASDMAGMTQPRFDGESVAPIVTILPATSVGATSAVLNAQFTYEGKKSIDEVGFEWKLSSENTYKTVTLENKTSPLTYKLEGLQGGKKYDFLAYVKINGVVTKSDSKDFTTVDPSAAEHKKISEIRALKPTNQSEKKTIDQNWKISGTVVSDKDGKNVNGKSMSIQDELLPNSGITIRFAANHNFVLGSTVDVFLSDAVLSFYNGQLQLTVSGDDKVKVTDAISPITLPVRISVAELNTNNYESMYVVINDTKVEAEHSGTTFYNDTHKGNVKVSSGSDGFIMYSGKSSLWASQVVPNGVGKLSGLAGVYTSSGTTVYQIMPQRESDFKYMINSNLKSISDIRKLLTENSYLISEDYQIVGVVVSNGSTETGGNINNKSLAIQDGFGVNSGIIIRFSDANNNKYKLGDEVSVSLINGTISLYNGTYQITPKEDAKIKITSTPNSPLLPIEISYEQLNTTDYQSMYVQIANVKVAASFSGKKFYENVTGHKGNVLMEVSGTSNTFTMYTTSYAAWKDTVLPTGTGKLKGLGGCYKSGSKTTYQIQPQKASDFEDLQK